MIGPTLDRLTMVAVGIRGGLACWTSYKRLLSLSCRGSPWRSAIARNELHLGSAFKAAEKGVSREVKNEGQLQTGFAEKAKEGAKTVSSVGVIAFGLGVTGIILYTVFNELFSGSGPTKLFQKASDQCVRDPRVQDMLGEPIKAFGEETRRGRRKHVSFLEYTDEEGRKGIRVKFYLQGVRKRATAHLDAREDSSGQLVTRFLLVQADDLLRTSIVVEDNR